MRDKIMKVYVMEYGQYSDRHVIGVTDDKKKARKICKMLGATYEEWDTEQFDVPNAIRYEVMAPGTYWSDEWYVEYDEYDIYDEYKENTEDYDGHYIIYADSPDQAVKIAQDMRAEKLAREAEISL